MYDTKEMVYVHNLEVDPLWRRSRLGSKLLCKLLRRRPRCHVLEGIFLPPSYAFWRRMGQLYLKDTVNEILQGDFEYLTLNRRRVMRLAE